ncbi:MAG: DUF1361 domain-containing protein [Bacteroidota bacterium]
MHIVRFLFWQYHPLLLSLGFAILLVFIRVIAMNTFFYSFLLWNLFLAAVPYILSQAILFNFHWKTPKVLEYGLWGIWLLLLPNAPYLITDLIHLHNDYSNWVWFDLFMMFVFASNGVVLFLLSLWDFFTFHEVNNRKHLLVILICFLSGYGIYTGRFLRFNSWDILLRPKILFSEIVSSIYHPNTWLMSIAFGLFLLISFSLFRWSKRSWN